MCLLYHNTYKKPHHVNDEALLLNRFTVSAQRITNVYYSGYLVKLYRILMRISQNLLPLLDIDRRYAY